MSLWRWSKTAASNQTADPTVNFREGQSPGSLNNASRAMMAAIAKSRDDASGLVITGGGSTAFTVASNQVFAALQDGMLVAFTPHTTSGENPTLNVDSLGAKPLRGQSLVALPTGTLIAGTPYVARYSTAEGGEWLLHGYFNNPASVPIGGSMVYLGSTPPSSAFAFPYGQAISRATYAALFALCGTEHGVGDGTTTFNLPDIRERAIFGWGGMGGASPGRITNAKSGIVGATKGAIGGNEENVLTIPELPTVTPAGTIAVTDPDPTFPSNMESVGTNVGFGGVNYWRNSGSAPTISKVNATAVFTGTPFGGGEGHNNMPPAIILPIIVRVI